MRATRFLLAAPLLFAAAGCTAAPPRPLRPACINHVVFFKLKDPAQAAQLIHDCNGLFEAVPVIATGWAGTRLETERGADAGGNFDVSFYAGFRTEADYDAYLDHPAHVAAATKWGPHLEWIRFHDVRDEAP